MPREDHFQDVTVAGNISLSATSKITPAFTPDRIGEIRIVGGQGTFETIQEAIDDLPSTGGTVYVPAGTHGSTSKILIDKPLILRGSGSNQALASVADQAEVTYIQNNSTDQNAIEINLGTTSGLKGGVILENFIIKGNDGVAGATAGSGIVFFGGTSSGNGLHNVTTRNVVVRDCKDHGFDIRDNAFELRFEYTASVQNENDGIHLSRPSAFGIPSQIIFIGHLSDENEGSGFLAESGVGGDSYLYECTFSGHTTASTWGIDNSASSHRMQFFGGDIEGNTQSGGIYLNGPGSNLYAVAFNNSGTDELRFGSGADTSLFQGCTFSGSKQVTIDSGTTDTYVGPFVASGGLTITDNGTTTRFNHNLRFDTNGTLHLSGTAAEMLTLNGANNPFIRIASPDGGSDTKEWIVQNLAGTTLNFRTQNDGGGSVVTRWSIDRSGNVTITGAAEIDGDLNHDGSNVGFYGIAPGARPGATADIKDALTTLGLLQGTSATPLNLDGGVLTTPVVNPLEGTLSNVPHWIFKLVDHTDMTAASTADTFTLWTLPANTMVHDVVGCSGRSLQQSQRCKSVLDVSGCPSRNASRPSQWFCAG